MYHVLESAKPFEAAATDLEEAVKESGFGVLHIHDIQATLKKKGIDFPNGCKVLEICTRFPVYK